MIFPERFEIHILDQDNKPILYSNIMVFITLFAPRKNNYDLGPLFSDKFGVISVNKNQLIILAEAVLETGLMDYCGYWECSKEILVEIFDYRDLNKLIYGRETWGIVGKEAILYESKENLLKKIKVCANHLVEPVKVYADFEGQALLSINIITRRV